MALPLKIKIRRGYFLAFLLLLLSYVSIFYVINELRKETKWITHSFEVITSLYSLKAQITDAETGVRGYIITKDIHFLTSYNNSAKNVLPLFGELKRLTEKNYSSKILLLEKLVHRRLQSLTDVVTYFENNGRLLTPEIIKAGEKNKSMRDSIQLLVYQIAEEEQALRKHRDENLQGIFATTQTIAIVSLIIAIITAVYSFITYNRENKAREKADNSAKLYAKELEENVQKLQQLNQELKELRSIEKFASTGRIARTIAHEVRNPLTNISLASEQLNELTAQNEDANVLIELINRNASRINQLVSDLLHSTRFAQLNYTTEDIRTLIEETLTMAGDRIELNNISVVKELGYSCPVKVDKEKIKLAFLNIIVNAIEAMKKGTGVLSIRTYLRNDKCIIEFADNGTGMNEETIQNLFEPYFTSKAKGNGLGLTNTQNIILNHGGSIQVHSEFGKGSIFIISLKTI